MGGAAGGGEGQRRNDPGGQGGHDRYLRATMASC